MRNTHSPCPEKTYREASAEIGEKQLSQCAMLVLLLTLIGGLTGCIQPFVLLPMYLLLAAGLHGKWKPARFLLAATMVLHLAWMLLRSVFGIPFCVLPKTFMILCHAMQWITCLGYLGITVYLYHSPDIAAYYQKTDASVHDA